MIPRKQPGKIVELGVADEDFKTPKTDTSVTTTEASVVTEQTTSGGGQATPPVPTTTPATTPRT